jgi:hypothetical protein
MVRWLIAFAFTQVVECPIWVGALRRCARARGPRRSGWLELGIAFGASAITHPIVWFVIPHLWLSAHRALGYWGMVATGEAFAVIVEAEYAEGFGLRRAWIWSLVANAASFGLGLLSRSVLGLP